MAAAVDDAGTERSFAAAIENGALTSCLHVPPPDHHRRRRRFQELEPDDAQLPADAEGRNGGRDVVADLLDECIPRDSDLDEQILERPMMERVLLLAVASLPPAAAQEPDFDVQPLITRLEASGGALSYYANGGFGAVPAPPAALANLEKRTFRTGEGEGGGGSGGASATCSICLEDFEDGEEISAMPCSRGHEFHPHCITKWLGISNMCPLCRHGLPTSNDDS